MKYLSLALVAGSLSGLCLFDASLAAQSTLELEHVRPTDRVLGRVDDNARVTLTGARHPFARPQFDAGELAADEPIERIQLLLPSDASQQQALEAWLAAQQDPQSPYYRQWLTPEEFGSRFGISDADLR